jgi:predicted nucleic acid-binding protein
MIKLVVDSNILFTYFWKNSVAQTLFLSEELVLCSPEYALGEIKKYEKLLIKKTKTDKKTFDEKRNELAVLVGFFPEEEYKEKLKESSRITPDKNDIDFIALALKMKCPLWSNDKKLKQQKKVRVLTTKEVIMLFD